MYCDMKSDLGPIVAWCQCLCEYITRAEFLPICGYCDSAFSVSSSSLYCLMTPGLSTDIRCHARPYSMFANYQSKHQTASKTRAVPASVDTGTKMTN